ncbi:hypothetical protein RJ639_030343 [Escallonia herrerae]|uniref:C2 domain-containing protein n=1 Tax=Escallonia herrerae TaxID=1293975 RepID=A0AA88XF88_9ASTE|nr:hypothetical protein RJ639_030343 [Escallonia herrerae]
MRLFVYVLEGKDWPVKDSYVKLQVGKFKSKTRVLKNTTNPVWNEEFVFRVHDMEDELVVSVYHHDDDSGFFIVSGDLVGRVRVPVWSVAGEENHNLPPTWFSLEKPKSHKSINQDCGRQAEASPWSMIKSLSELRQHIVTLLDLFTPACGSVARGNKYYLQL